jgi:hypothetical protein
MITPAAFSATTREDNGFIIDSGATHHMAWHASLFRCQKPTNETVTTASHEELLCKIKREVILINHAGEQVLLRDVLLLPDITCNLLSIRKADEVGVNAHFSRGKVTFKTSTNKTLLTGISTGSLYELNGHALTLAQATPAVSEASPTAEKQIETPSPPQPAGGGIPLRLGLLWHRRLGHIGNTLLTKMAANRRPTGLPAPGTFSTTPICWA